MTASFEPFGGAAAVSPDATFDELMDRYPARSDEDLPLLTHLQHSWNRLDLCEYAPMFRGSAKRKMLLKDLAAVRKGGTAYYSLGATPERLSFAGTFLRLRSRRLQELFMECATVCLHQNRFMTQADLVSIVQEGNGKRHQQQQHYEHDIVMERANKRQRTACFGGSSSNGIQCFS